MKTSRAIGYLFRKGKRYYIELIFFLVLVTVLQRVVPSFDFIQTPDQIFLGFNSESAAEILKLAVMILPNIFFILAWIYGIAVLVDYYNFHYTGLQNGIGRSSIFISGIVQCIFLSLVLTLSHVFLQATSPYPNLLLGWETPISLLKVAETPSTLSLLTRGIDDFIRILSLLSYGVLCTSIASRLGDRNNRGGYVFAVFFILQLIFSIISSLAGYIAYRVPRIGEIMDMFSKIPYGSNIAIAVGIVLMWIVSRGFYVRSKI